MKHLHFWPECTAAVFLHSEKTNFIYRALPPFPVFMDSPVALALSG